MRWIQINFIILLFIGLGLKAQEANKILTLEQVLALSKSQSPEAMLAKHRYLSSFWEFKSYQAGLLPQLNLQSNLLNWNNSFEQFRNPDGSVKYVPSNNISSQIGLALNQNIGFTGGNLFIQSDVSGLQDFIDTIAPRSYTTVPFEIGFSQPLFQYNAYKWQRKIEPLKYQEAKREYILRMEEISSMAINYFYDLATAQLNVEIAKANYYNNDTIFKIAQGRYNIGTIAENDVLQIELTFLNAKSAWAQAKINLENSKFRLRSFLGFNDLVRIQLVIPNAIPLLEVEVTKALQLAKENNGAPLSWQRQLYEAESEVARTRAEKRFNANLSASYGLNGSAYSVKDSYTEPSNKLGLRVGVDIPILDWGKGKGRYRMAQSQQEVVKTQVEQARIDFEQRIMLQVMQFNEQDDQVVIAAKADTIAKKRYEVTKQRFLIGKIDILDLNVASQENDVAQRSYIQAQKTYWSYYYGIRQYTLYDFVNDRPLDTDFGELEK